MTARKLRFSLLMSLLLASCANVASDFKFDPAKPTGLVIGSISYESGLGKFYLYATSPSAPRPVSFAFGCSLWPCIEPSDDSSFSASETPKQRGGGFAVEVPEGTYRLVGWSVIRGALQSRSTSPIDIEFIVERGKATYIGNLHFDAHWEDVQLRDKASRDLPLLQEKYAALKTTPLSFAIASGTVLKGIGGTFQTRMEGPIYMPIVRVR